MTFPIVPVPDQNDDGFARMPNCLECNDTGEVDDECSETGKRACYECPWEEDDK